MPNESQSLTSALAQYVSDVQKTLENLKKIEDQLNKARSVVCTIDNVTDFPLTFAGSHHEHGAFDEPPPAVIPARKSIAFSSQSSAGSLLTGTAGWVNYASAFGELFYMHWDNPWTGDNGSDARLAAGDARFFRVWSVTGGGDQKARQSFVLLQNFTAEGAILAKYLRFGGRQGFLGLATTSELVCPDGLGRFTHFQGGSIYWSPKTDAFEVHGAIRDKWASLGFEVGFLGYPVSDETVTPDLRGRFNHFQGGSIYWTPQTGAHEVHGAIREFWAKMGYERGSAGYPTSDETATGDGRGRISHFEHGTIVWTPEGGARFLLHGVDPFKEALNPHRVVEAVVRGG